MPNVPDPVVQGEADNFNKVPAGAFPVVIAASTFLFEPEDTIDVSLRYELLFGELESVPPATVAFIYTVIGVEGVIFMTLASDILIWNEVEAYVYCAIVDTEVV